MSDADIFRAAIPTSTDPARLEREAKRAEERDMSESKIDGRNARSAATRAKIVAACRKLMLAGDFRPSMVEVSRAAGCSIRSVFQHFKDVRLLHKIAMDAGTQDAIVRQIMPGLTLPSTLVEDICSAIVFGHPPPRRASAFAAAVGDAAEAAL
jgi:AcrR family transcriptional regulator